MPVTSSAKATMLTSQRYQAAAKERPTWK